MVAIDYACLLAESGRLVDSSRAIGQNSDRFKKPFTAVIGAGAIVNGMDAGLRRMTLGTLARLHVPSALGYGADGDGKAVPANADLVFEVELVGINNRRAQPRSVPVLRALLMRPPPASEEGLLTITHEASSSIISRGSSSSSSSSLSSSSNSSSSSNGSYERDPLEEDDDVDDLTDDAIAAADAVPHDEAARRWPWVSRLRPLLQPPLEEHASFFDLLQSFDKASWRRAVLQGEDDGGGDGAQALLPGTLPIQRAAYGTKFDSRTPMVLTGPRAAWPGFLWGWDFWSKTYGEDLATAKQRAPIFDSDRWADTVVAEASVAEYIEYARSAHKQSVDGQRATAIMYMNGLEIFGKHPELWGFEMERLQGQSSSHGVEQSIDNRTASEYATVYSSLGMDANEQVVTEATRNFCKLFLSPRGAATRMHQDNHHAHAWLSQVRGRKLYVVCPPQDYPFIVKKGTRSADEGGTTREAYFDPLNATQRKEKMAAGLRVYATVLQPGETIVCPDSWWHYAVSLTPSITLSIARSGSNPALIPFPACR